MESKNLKPRILAAMRVIGEPATASEIRDISGIEEPIHARLCEMKKAGEIVGIKGEGQATLYAISDATAQACCNLTDPVSQPEPEQDPVQIDTYPTRYTAIFRDINTQMTAIESAITAYANEVLGSDPIYCGLVEAKDRLTGSLAEMAMRGLV